MTTFEPGASEVFTHGLTSSPRSTALRASRPAPIITLGFDVFVHDVIAAITTWPWSSSVSVPSASVSGTTVETRSATCAPPVPAPASSSAPRSCDGVAVRGGRVGGREGLLGPLVGLGVRRLDEVLEREPERRLGLGERHAVLRALRAGERRHDLAEVELERLGVGRLLGVLVVPQALRAGVGLDALDDLGRAAGELEVAERLGVDREDRAGRAELRRHVADRRPVGERQVRDALPVELDELADDAVAAQLLGHGEHEVGRRRALAQLARELEADHARDQHRHRLAEHRGLRLDAADAPAEHAEAVDHRRVGVRPDERVGVQDAVVLEHDAGEVLEVDLVDDPRVRRHDLEALERGLAPAQEGVALPVALELLLHVVKEGLGRSEGVDLHGVVDDELDRHERVDRRRVAAHLGHRVAQRRQVDDARHAREVLQDHAGGREGDLLRGLGLRVPRGERLDVLRADADAVLVAQQVLEQHLQRERQARDVVGGLQCLEGVDLICAPADLELGPRAEGILGSHGPSSVAPAYPGCAWRTSGTTRGRRPSCPASDACASSLGGATIADSTRALRVLETSHPPTIYIPPADVGPERPPPGGRQLAVRVQGPRRLLRRRSAATGRWPSARRGAIPRPRPPTPRSPAHVAFYPGRMDAAWLGDERIAAQEGDFYGGWITADLTGPFKGAAGTLGW